MIDPRAATVPVAVSAVAFAAMFAGSASAQPVVIPIDEATSGIDAEVCIDFGGGQCDNASTAVNGNVEIELDDYGTPTSITLLGFSGAANNALSLNYNFGFLGSANANLAGLTVSYSGTPITTPIVNGNEFTFVGVLTDVAGIATVNASLFIIGDINETIDLAADGPVATDLMGTIDIIDGEVVIAGMVDTTVTEVVEGITITSDIMVDLNGSAPVPEQSCAADFNDDGIADFFDVQQFLGAFAAMDPAADTNNDGVFDFFDVQLFLGEFAIGCP